MAGKILVEEIVVDRVPQKGQALCQMKDDGGVSYLGEVTSLWIHEDRIHVFVSTDILPTGVVVMLRERLS